MPERRTPTWGGRSRLGEEQHPQRYPPTRTATLILTRQKIARLLDGTATTILIQQADPEHPPVKAGHRLSVHSRVTKPATCKVAVQRVTSIRLGDLDDEHARKLGHDDLEALMQAWVAKPGRLWNENAHAWLLRVIVDPAADVRLLHRDSTRGYTSSMRLAVPGEPEAVDDQALRLITSDARRGDARIQTARETELDEQPLPQRLSMAIETARLKGIDIRDDLRAAERAIRSAERRTHQRAA